MCINTFWSISDMILYIARIEYTIVKIINIFNTPPPPPPPRLLIMIMCINISYKLCLLPLYYQMSMLYSWDIYVLMIHKIATVHPWNMNPWGPHWEFIMAWPCNHGRGHDGNGTLTLASREWTHHIVSLFGFILNYIVIIIKYIIVWPFLVLLFKY